jgi:hypothetical protein
MSNPQCYLRYQVLHIRNRPRRFQLSPSLSHIYQAIMETIFPKIEQKYYGPNAAFYFFVIMTIIITIRSLIHIFAEDGGAVSITGIPLDMHNADRSGQNIIAMSSQWGSNQLVLAVIYWITLLFYQCLIPTMILVILLEQILRLSTGNYHPVYVHKPPPGAWMSLILIPMTLIMFITCLTYRKEQEVKNQQ